MNNAKPTPPPVKVEDGDTKTEEKVEKKEIVRKPHLTHRPFISPALAELRKTLGGKR